MHNSATRQRKPTPSTMPSPPHRCGHRPALVSYHEIEPYHQENEFILHGYRPENNSTYKCFLSWLYLHNESVNIFSHLIPSIAAIFAEFLSYQYFVDRYPKATHGDRLALAFFLLAAAICLGISATYHTLISHSEKVCMRWLRLDYVGIVILIEGFFVSGIYVGFYCEQTLQKVYWAMILSLGGLTAFILLNPRFQSRRHRTFRLGTFVCTGLSAFVPICHGISLFGWKQMNRQAGLSYYLLEGALILVGVYFYNLRAPECFKPGRFDIWGASHQIFHLLVVVAAGVHLVGIKSAYEYNYIMERCSA